MADCLAINPSPPYTLDVRNLPGGVDQTCQFFIPRGVWTAGTWELIGTFTGFGQMIHTVSIGTDPASTVGTISDPPGAYDDVIAVTIDQMVSINFAASGVLGSCGSLIDVTLHAANTWIADLGQSDGVSQFILHLTGYTIECGNPCNAGNAGPPIRPLSIRYPWLGTWNKQSADCHVTPPPALLQIAAERHMRLFNTGTPYWMPGHVMADAPSPPVDLPGYLLFMESLGPTLYMEGVEATMAMDSAEPTLKMDAQYK